MGWKILITDYLEKKKPITILPIMTGDFAKRERVKVKTVRNLTLSSKCPSPHRLEQKLGDSERSQSLASQMENREV